MLKLKCTGCGSDLRLTFGYSGADWNTVKGNGSGYGIEVSLDCTNKKCGLVYTLGHIKNYGDFVELKEEWRCYVK